MKKKTPSISPPQLDSLIYTVRGLRVMLDSDLARVYGVTTAALNQAVQRNADRFPEDFAFRLRRREVQQLISQNVISKPARGGRTKPPRAFTEHGALQAANILRSASAVQMSLFVTRAFVKMRETLLGTGQLAKKLAALEKKLTGRLDVHEAAIVGVLQELMRMLNPPPGPPSPPKKQIGFHP